ncbi:hypothetical protein LIER_38040 [Lithospermum erythrorhizon]|uniref:RING-type E3 ubiquitin transferase n=1 Tax=Lithospermum erythrorhizon TaxID=34254 RepID=A0AAV3PXW5_LITER
MAASSIQDILEPFHSRKLLSFPTFHQSPNDAAGPPSSHDQFSRSTTLIKTLNANVITVVSVLICALICSFFLNSIIRCALRCSSVISSGNLRGNIPTGAPLADTGIKNQALETFPVVNYPGDLKFPGLDNECAICLTEFAPGNRIRVLPKCSHGFHVNCIDRWLNCHSSCPTCRHCLIETCQKIACSEALVSDDTTPPRPSVETTVRIAPLQLEGVVRSHHT